MLKIKTVKEENLKIKQNPKQDELNPKKIEEKKEENYDSDINTVYKTSNNSSTDSNCDSINEQDYRDVYDYHCNNHNDMTIVTMVKSFKIPYGVIETGEDGLMVSLSEKPELTYQVNTGVYILNPNCIDEIPQGEFFHITHLMEKIKDRGGRVGCFPVSEHAWKDMGEWPEYLKMIDVL